MPNGSNTRYESFTTKNKMYLLIITILLIILCIYNYIFIPVAVVVLACLVGYNIWNNNKRKAELSDQLRDLTLNVNNAAKTTLINSPFPLVIMQTNGNLIWKSEKYVSIFGNIDMSEPLNELIKTSKIIIENSEQKDKGKIDSEISIDNKIYKVLGSYVKSKDYIRNKKNNNKDLEYTVILYFVDNTTNVKLEQERIENSLNVGIIMVDNYEEIIQRISSDQRSQFTAEIEKSIYEWAAKYDSLVIKSDRDTFYFIIEQSNLRKVKDDKISILDDIKKLELHESIQATLSIAVSDDGFSDIEKARSARAVIDIALGRGGDQAIIKTNGRYEFFGGRSQEVEKRTKVKARMISHALKELISESDNVVIMGHKNGDMDSIGSSLGIYRLAKTLGKEAKIVNDNVGLGIENFIITAKKSEEYSDCFETSEETLQMVKSNSLLVIVDTNKKDYVDSKELLEKVQKVVVIDHHRRSTDYIENAILTFHEVYASSASELVTEILEYSQSSLKLTNIEMEALYAGIMLDTKNFTFKTGVRTFEAAAFLRKCGVDIIKVKKWFQSDLETYQIIADIVSRSEIMNETIAISTYENKTEVSNNANIIAAKAADELLTIRGITASFVLGKMNDEIYISGRSIGDINVQLILEKLGGGGHITLAGAQVKDMTMEDAKQELINRINEYFFEIEN